MTVPKRCLRVVAALAVAAALAGCGRPSHHAAAPALPATTAPTSTAPGATATTAKTTITTAAPTATTTGVPAPAGGPVPAGFEVQSATFVSDQQGWVLGTAPCSSAPCTSMVRTTDGGRQWQGIPAPRDLLATGSAFPASSGVRGVRFADPADGWVFGSDLWSTHDGGATWNRLTIGGSLWQVIDRAAAGGEVDAIITHCTLNAVSCPAQLG